MKLSVVIPNLHSPVLDQTLAALAGQTWPREQTEVVVVGLDRYGYLAAYPWVRDLNTGTPTPPARARNLGVRATSGDIVVFLDADGIPAPDWLARLAGRFADPSVNVVGGGVVFAWDAPYWSVCDNVSNFHPFVTSAPAGERPNLPTLNLAIRRAVLDHVGLFNETYPKAAGEDTELMLRLRAAGYRLDFEPRAVVEHRQARVAFGQVWRKAHDIGYYSPRLDPRYRAYLDFPPPLRHPLALRLASPVLAAVMTARIYRDRPALRRRAVWPGVFLAKLAWCWGAAQRLTIGDWRLTIEGSP